MSKKPFQPQPSPFLCIEAIEKKTGGVNVVVETVRGSQNKLRFDAERGVFTISHVLAAGSVFPYDFGFVPSTLGEDGDPVDVLILMDAPTTAGCLVPCRLIGVIEAKQRERDGSTQRNDRLVGVALRGHRYAKIHRLSDLDAHLLDELEEFFIHDNRAQGKRFKPLGRGGPKTARKLLAEGIRRHAREHKPG